eukprot:gnl/TRDRNA2_/TRDRNA2_186632_c0_seq1.p1 gnl/TRDRNA2_/TRDRNA2_186632_c0~~gnl/TRDRNA2_/TRDRNA2_186632_c0_seq1.p1  ORF type:complete len:648 (-),score=118.46 gnl/TRDRNA2_/TRDRNA2_186632_c0_seq1:114-2057(-)
MVNYGKDEFSEEVDYAKFETRMHALVLELLDPTLKKSTALDSNVTQLRSELERMNLYLTELTRKFTAVEKEYCGLENFKMTLATWDKERRQKDHDTTEKIASIRGELEGFRYSQERKDAAIHSIQRTNDRLVAEMTRLQEAIERQRHFHEKQITHQAALLHDASTTLEVKIATVETRLHKLGDEVWGEETGLAKVSAGLSKMTNTVLSLSETISNMEHNKASKSQLAHLQEEVNKLLSDANYNVMALKESIGRTVNDVKEHFKTVTKVTAAQNSTMLAEARNTFAQDMNESAKARAEMMSFIEKSEKQFAKLENAVNSTQDQIQKAVEATQGDVEGLTSLRKQDQMIAQHETKMLTENMHEVKDSSEAVMKTIEHLSSILGMILKSERMSAALDTQDNSDRAKVALMGFTEPEASPTRNKRGSSRPNTSSTSSRPSTVSTRASAMGDHYDSATTLSDMGDGMPSVSIDNRCMSCSGQASTIVSGFKMACLQYTPGPVSYGKREYKRVELLDLRQSLLNQAYDALANGPEMQDLRRGQKKEAGQRVSYLDNSRFSSLGPASPLGYGSSISRPIHSGGSAAEDLDSLRTGSAGWSSLPEAPATDNRPSTTNSQRSTATRHMPPITPRKGSQLQAGAHSSSTRSPRTSDG